METPWEVRALETGAGADLLEDGSKTSWQEWRGAAVHGSGAEWLEMLTLPCLGACMGVEPGGGGGGRRSKRGDTPGIMSHFRTSKVSIPGCRELGSAIRSLGVEKRRQFLHVNTHISSMVRTQHKDWPVMIIPSHQVQKCCILTLYV